MVSVTMGRLRPLIFFPASLHPLASGRGNVEDRVHHLAQIGCARSANGSRRRHIRRNPSPFIVRGVTLELVSQVARRYDVNANQVFNWLKDSRFSDAEPPDTEQYFLPVEIVDGASVSAPVEEADFSVLEIDLAGGHRLRIRGAYDADALARLIRGLSS